MFIHVEKAEYLKDYSLKLEFNNDETKIVDLKDELYGEVFEPLKDKDFLKIFFYPIILLNGKMGLILHLSFYMK